MPKRLKYVNRTQVLHLLMKDNWKDFVDSFLESNAVNTTRINGYSLLSCAVECGGDSEIIEYLMQKGARIDAKNFDGTVPLHVASAFGDQELVEFFIKSSAFIDCRDHLKRTPLHHVTGAFSHGPTEQSVFKSKIEKTSDNLLCCATERHVEIAALLLDNGADCNASDTFGDMPLLLAAIHGCVKVVELLIKRGAKVDCIDDSQWTVLHHASFHGWSDIVTSLTERKVNLESMTPNWKTSLLLAAEQGRKKCVEILIKSGADVECRDIFKMTALHYAAERGWLDVVQLLVDRTPDIQSKTYSGATPLMMAVKGKHRDVFDVLRDYGAALGGNDGKMTMLHYACLAGWLDVVQSLLDGGSEIDVTDSLGCTPLLLTVSFFYYVRGGCCVLYRKEIRKALFNLLLNSGANPHVCDKKKMSPFLYACNERWLDTVQRIVKAGADINIQNGSPSPLMIAAKNEDIDMFSFLFEAGADVNLSSELCLFLNRRQGLFMMIMSIQWRQGLQILIQKGFDLNLTCIKGRHALLHTAIYGRNKGIVADLLKAGANCNLTCGKGTPFDYYVRKSLDQDLEFDEDLELLPLFVKSGAYINQHVYYELYKYSDFKNIMLKDASLCTQAVLNKYNFLDLVEIYKVPPLQEKLPPIERMWIGSSGNVARSVEATVAREIDVKGFCNLIELHPMELCLLCVRSLISNYKNE